MVISFPSVVRKATVLDCLQTVMEEEFWHNRYALRDLAVLEQTT